MATTFKITGAETIDISAFLKDKNGIALTGSKLQSALTNLATFEAKVETNKSASLTVGNTKFSYSSVKASGLVGPALSFKNGASTFTTASALITSINSPTPAPTPAPTAAPTPAPTAAPTPAPTAAPTPAPTSYSIKANNSIITEGSSSTFTVTRAGDSTKAVTLLYNITGDDAGGSVSKAVPGTSTSTASGSVTIAAGATTGTFTVSAVQNNATDNIRGYKVALLDGTTGAALGVSTSGLIIDDANAPVAGQTFTLTTGTDNRTGSTGADTFDAGLSSSGLQTLNSGDRLDGGAGTDELFAVINGSVTPASMSSVENVTVTVVTNASTVDLANATGVESVVLAGSTAAATVAGISKSVSVTLRDSAVAHTISYNNVTGTADSATVSVSNLSGVAMTIAGVETLNIVANGTDSSIGSLTSANTTTLNVSGSKALNVVDNLGATVLTVVASANTGGVNLDFGAGAMNVTGGAGNDDFSFEAAGDVVVNGGAGNDTFRFDATGTLTTADTVEGGDGTDTLRARSEELDDFTAAPTTFRITGIERITADTAVVAGATINVPFISTTADRLTLTAANAGAATFNFNAGASTLVNTAATVGAITVDAAGTATADSLTITHGGASAVDSLNGQALTSTDFETVTINTTGTGAAGAQTVGAISVTASTGGTPTLAITGSNQLTTGVITATAGAIDASGMTASTNGLIMVTGQNTASRITGSAVADTLFGAITTAISQTIDGGAGNDAITGGSGNDVLIGGDGNDTINGGAGNDNINGGAGNDRVVVAADANLTAADTVVGGDGTDTLAFTAAITDAASTFQAFSGFEILELAPGAASTITLSNFINNQTFTRVDFGDAGGNTITANNVGAAVVTLRLIEGVTGDTVVFDRLVDNSTNAVTIDARNTTAQTVTALTANDEETITYSSVNAAADVTITTMNASDLTSLTISGDGDLIVSNALSSTLVSTVNASAATGAVTISAANAVVGVTMTGGSGVNTFTGGVLADNITGGAGADVLVGGAGDDTINGGAGSDSITGAAGADVINVGSGTDRLILSADAQTAVTTLATNNTGTTVTLSGADVVTGMGASDLIRVTGLGYTAVGDNANATLLAAADTNLTNGIVDNTFAVIRGSYIQTTASGTGTFIQNSAGSDTLLIIDADETAAAQSFEAVVLVGVSGITGTAALAGGQVDITLASL
jgi:Ca2+-binding RTX toxin-like protein